MEISDDPLYGGFVDLYTIFWVNALEKCDLNLPNNQYRGNELWLLYEKLDHNTQLSAREGGTYCELQLASLKKFRREMCVNLNNFRLYGDLVKTWTCIGYYLPGMVGPIANPKYKLQFFYTHSKTQYIYIPELTKAVICQKKRD